MSDNRPVIGCRTVVEVAWRVLAAQPRGGRRHFGLACRSVRGRDAVRALASAAFDEAWNGELRIRLEGAHVLYTHVLEVAHWPDIEPLPRARADSLWYADARQSANAAAFLSRLRPVIEAAAASCVMHRRDAQVLLTLAAAACEGSISRSA